MLAPRAVPVYAAVRALGRRGIADIIERCSNHAYRLATEIGALEGAELLVTPQINQGLCASSLLMASMMPKPST